MKLLKPFLLLSLLLVLPAFVLAQDASPVPTVDSVLAMLITAATSTAVMLVLWGLREAMPKIPPLLIPTLAAALGAGLSYLEQLQSITGGSAIRGAIVGLGAVVVRSLLNQIGVNVSPNKVASLLLIVGLVGLSGGCASTGSARKVGYQGVSATTAALNLVQVTKNELHAAGVLNDAVNKRANDILIKALKVNGKAIDTFDALPGDLKSATPEVLGFIVEVWSLIDEIRGIIAGADVGKAEALSKRIEPLRASSLSK